MELAEKLRERAATGNPVLVGVVGCGQMGSGLLHVIKQMMGMKAPAMSDIDVNRPLRALKAMGIPESAVCCTDRLGEAEDAIRSGRCVVTEDALLLTQLPSLDAVVEATGLTEVGAMVAWNSILHHKHVIMLNVETDVTVGVLLHRLAQKAGVVYTAASGDEPGVCKMLYDFATSLGFEVVCLGKGKNNPINLDATPESCHDEALRRGMNPKMLAAFQDGSKTMVELAAMSNATGLVPDVPGMHGPKVDVPELNRVFVPLADGGILNRRGCVDYSTGKVAPGVFLVYTTPDPRIRVDLEFVGQGPGPYYALYRPYHLCNIETPISIAEAVLYGEPTIFSARMVSEVATIAKRDLRTGERVGDIGSPDVLGRTYAYQGARAQRAIPLGIAPGGLVVRDIAKGALLTEDNFQPDASKFVYRLRSMQDAQLEMDR